MCMLYSSLEDRPRYYPFDDFPLGVFIIVFVLVLCSMVKVVIFKLGQYSGTWGLKGNRKKVWTKLPKKLYLMKILLLMLV